MKKAPRRQLFSRSLFKRRTFDAKCVKFWLENSPRSCCMHREKHFYFKMLINFEPNVAQWSVASRNDHKSKACLPEASNTAFAESCVCRRTNQIFYQPVFQLAWFAILCAMTDLIKSDFRVSLGFWKTKPYLASPSPCSFVVDTFCHKVRSQKEKTILFGKFSQHGGGGVFPNPKTFVNLPSIFLYAKFILRC